MPRSDLLSHYMKPLLRGERKACREMVIGAMEQGTRPRDLYRTLIWPAMERVELMYREDRLNAASEHLATRINRTVVRPDNAAIRGMVRKLHHLVSVEEIEEETSTDEVPDAHR